MHFQSSAVISLAFATSIFAAPSPTRTTKISRRAANSSTKYVINFGDSYSQTGFNASLTLPSANNILGNPTFPGYTTVNGNKQNWLDNLIAEYNTSLTLAANLAVGGATTDANLVTPYAPFPTVYSFKDQVGDFETYLDPAPSAFPWTTANTLFSVWMGVNDVGNAWYASNWADLKVEILDEYFGLVDTLYNAGARKFLFLTVPPIYLTPFIISQGSDTVAALKTAIPQYNDLLSAHVKNLTSTHSDVKAWLFDTNSSFAGPVANPTAYGATDATCYSETGTNCLWFNNYHPGQAIQDLVGKGVANLIGNW